MRKLFKWESKPSGNCPVQSNGWFLNYYFYFRSRGETASIEFYNDKGDYYYDEPLKRFILKRTNAYEAGWLSNRLCKFLILKGCLMFMFNNRNSEK